MPNAPVALHEFTAVVRSAMVARVVSNIRAKGIQPAPVVLEWLAAYSREELTHTQLLHLLRARVDQLRVKTAALLAPGYHQKCAEQVGKAPR
jgi:hypothetical protein